MLKKLLLALIFSIAAIPVAFAEEIIICASTTSTQNSGLFEHILPAFEKKTGIRIKVVAVGTGAALEIGKRGDADVVFVHAKDDELKMVDEGWFTDRHDVMYNDFVIVGPAEDAAGIKGMKDTVAALKKVAGAKAVFVSRGDDSGTHKKELSMWKKAQIAPKGQQWYLEVGQGEYKGSNLQKSFIILSDPRFMTFEGLTPCLQCLSLTFLDIVTQTFPNDSSVEEKERGLKAKCDKIVTITKWPG
ncbi:MAG: substrate-binding domain-containing protein [Nitrospirae bacterium]|nr:substrate-binding domain-containing protein [Nitrospirota bacterium]